MRRKTRSRPHIFDPNFTRLKDMKNNQKSHDQNQASQNSTQVDINENLKEKSKTMEQNKCKLFNLIT